MAIFIFEPSLNSQLAFASETKILHFLKMPKEKRSGEREFGQMAFGLSCLERNLQDSRWCLVSRPLVPGLPTGTDLPRVCNA
jgi:hypothetical protein